MCLVRSDTTEVVGAWVCEVCEWGECKIVCSSDLFSDGSVEIDDLMVFMDSNCCKLSCNELLVLCEFFLSVWVEEKDCFSICAEGDEPITMTCNGSDEFGSRGVVSYVNVNISNGFCLFIFWVKWIISWEDFVEISIAVSTYLIPESFREFGAIWPSKNLEFDSLDINEVVPLPFEGKAMFGSSSVLGWLYLGSFSRKPDTSYGS